MSDVLAWLGVLSPVGLAVLGYVTFLSNRKMNVVLEEKARASVTRTVAETEKADVTTEEVWQRLYQQAMEELSRSTAASTACKELITKLGAEVDDLKKDNIVLKAEVIRLGGDPALLGLRRNGPKKEGE